MAVSGVAAPEFSSKRGKTKSRFMRHMSRPLAAITETLTCLSVWRITKSERRLWVNLEEVLPLLSHPDKVPELTLDDAIHIDQDHLHNGIQGWGWLLTEEEVVGSTPPGEIFPRVVGSLLPSDSA
jgi:hypothetical protein